MSSGRIPSLVTLVRTHILADKKVRAIHANVHSRAVVTEEAMMMEQGSWKNSNGRKGTERSIEKKEGRKEGKKKKRVEERRSFSSIYIDVQGVFFSFAKSAECAVDADSLLA